MSWWLLVSEAIEFTIFSLIGIKKDETIYASKRKKIPRIRGKC